MPRLAVLTTDLILVGYEDAETVPDGRVEVPADCDLPTDGKYLWNGKAFMPRLALPPALAAAGQPEMPASVAIALGLVALSEGKPLPASSRQWALNVVAAYKAMIG